MVFVVVLWVTYLRIFSLVAAVLKYGEIEFVLCSMTRFSCRVFVLLNFNVPYGGCTHGSVS